MWLNGTIIFEKYSGMIQMTCWWQLASTEQEIWPFEELETKWDILLPVWKWTGWLHVCVVPARPWVRQWLGNLCLAAPCVTSTSPCAPKSWQTAPAPSCSRGYTSLILCWLCVASSIAVELEGNMGTWLWFQIKHTMSQNFLLLEHVTNLLTQLQV